MSNIRNFEKKLRSVGLRPTRQRLDICEVLFDRKETFHFTIDDIRKILKTKQHTKISICLLYTSDAADE